MTFKAGFGLGLGAGVFWLLFAGVPLFVPSYLELAIDYRAAASAAAAQEERGDLIQDNREEEGVRALEDLDAERSSCQARLDRQRESFLRTIEDMIEGQSNGQPIADAPMCADPIRIPGGGL